MNGALYHKLLGIVEIIAMIDIIMAVAGFAVYLAGVAWFCFKEARERRPGFPEFPAGASLRPSTNLTNNEGVITMTAYVEDKAVDDIILAAEELEEVIAPGITIQHNETLVDEVELNAEEMEEVIAPGIATNHNETLVSD